MTCTSAVSVLAMLSPNTTPWSLLAGETYNNTAIYGGDFKETTPYLVNMVIQVKCWAAEDSKCHCL